MISMGTCREFDPPRLCRMASLDHRRQRDISDLLENSFYGPSASIACRSLSHETMSCKDNVVVEFCVCVHQGPYRGGHYVFKMYIGEEYPFLGPQVVCSYPIWHPNVDLMTGATRAEMVWSPLMTLVKAVKAVTEVLIKPSIDYYVNLAAAKSYSENSQLFELEVQLTLQGGVHRNVYFPPCRSGCNCCSSQDHFSVSRTNKRTRSGSKGVSDESLESGDWSRELGCMDMVADTPPSLFAEPTRLSASGTVPHHMEIPSGDVSFTALSPDTLLSYKRHKVDK